jgi:uncharacterized phage-associated protein
MVVIATTKSGRVAELICFYVRRCPRIGRTQLVKLIYLSDLFSRQFLGESLTDLDYIWWHHGPFDSRILAEISALADARTIREKSPNANGHHYAAAGEPSAWSLTEDETEVVNFIAEQYGRLSAHSLTRKVAKTAPMVDAKQRAGFGKRLRMHLADNTKRELFLGIKEGFKQIDRGEGIPFSQIRSRVS